MQNPDQIRNKLLEGQISKGGELFSPPPLPLLALMLYCGIYTVLSTLLCILIYVFIFINTGREKIIDASLWPIFTNYPFLTLPPLLLALLFSYLNWRVDKRERNTILILFPDGFIQYLSWSDASQCQTRVVEYNDVEKFVLETWSRGITLEVCYKSGRQERLLITRKYGTTQAKSIAQQIINDRLHSTQRS